MIFLYLLIAVVGLVLLIKLISFLNDKAIDASIERQRKERRRKYQIEAQRLLDHYYRSPLLRNILSEFCGDDLSVYPLSFTIYTSAVYARYADGGKKFWDFGDHRVENLPSVDEEEEPSHTVALAHAINNMLGCNYDVERYSDGGTAYLSIKPTTSF